jgi:hypothetical protein
MSVLMLLILGYTEQAGMRTVCVDWIEESYVYSEDTGKLVFSQYILWRIDSDGSPESVGWIHLGDLGEKRVQRIARGVYELKFYHKRCRGWYRVRSQVFFVTHLTFDPDVDDNAIHLRRSVFGRVYIPMQ